MKLRFNPLYFTITTLLLAIEVAIAHYLKDGFIRYTIGDFLVVILMYSFIRSFTSAPAGILAWATLAIAYGVELLQWANVLDYLGLRRNPWAALILGTHFSYEDLIAYTLGVLSIYFIDVKTQTQCQSKL